MTCYNPSEADREKLKQPQGEAFQGERLVEELKKRDYSKIVAVGDRVSKDIAKSRVNADISIVDGSIQRQDVGHSHFNDIEADRTFRTRNPAGEIAEDAWRTVRKASALKCKSKIIVEGEEDLLALPALLFAPEDAVVVYGHWKQGAILMEPSKDKKDFVQDLVGLKRSEHLIVGGSWDIFHSGHRYILLTALEKGSHIDIGITSDEMLAEKLNNSTADSFDQRRSNIKEFLSSQGRLDDADLIKINDFYGNAVEEGEKLLVNPENIGNAEKINQKRAEEVSEPIDIDILEKLEAADDKPISCTRIRSNKIDQDGLKNTKT